MSKKINFSIDSYQILEENPLLALLELDIVCEFDNPNQTYFSIEAIEDASNKSLAGIPIICTYDEDEKDFLEHSRNEEQFKNQSYVGFVPESNKKTYVEKVVNGSKRRFLRCVAAIWKLYAPDVYEKLKNNVDTKISMEILVEDEEPMKNGLINIKSFMFSGITLLGSKFNTGIPLANAKMIKFSSPEYIHMVQETNKQLKTFSIPESVKDNAKKALDLPQKNPQLIQFAKEILNSESFTYSKITQLFSKINNLRKEENILFYGGDEGREFYKNTILEFEKEEDILQKQSFSNEEKIVNKEVNNTMKLNQYGLTSDQTREIIYNEIGKIKYTSGDYECRKYWLCDYDETYIYVCDNETDETKRMNYTISDNVAVVDYDSAVVVIRAGYTPVEEVNENNESNENAEGNDNNEEYSKEDYVKLKADYEEMCGKFADIEAKYADIEEKFTALTEKFATVEAENATYVREKEEMKMSEKVNEFAEFLSDEEKKEFSEKIKESTYAQIKEMVEERVATKAKFALKNPKTSDNAVDGIKINFSALPVFSQEKSVGNSLVDKLKNTFGK